MSFVLCKKMTETAHEPTKGSMGAAGYDLYADINETVWIQPGETTMIWSGVGFEIPDGHVGLVFSRSGISTKRCLLLANGVGVIDSDYRGIVGLPLRNLSSEKQSVRPQERIAQIVFVPYLDTGLIMVDELTPTERGSDGFGSSGR